jgi:hypothetical protein
MMSARLRHSSSTPRTIKKMQKYNSTLRDKNADELIARIKEQTNIESLYDLVQQDIYIGHRVHECGAVFMDRLVELADTEEKVLIAILTLQGSWTKKYFCHYMSRSSQRVFWHIAPYFKKLGMLDENEKPDYITEHTHKLPSQEKLTGVIDQIRERYCRFINTLDGRKRDVLIRLVDKLDSYHVCRLIFTESRKDGSGDALLKKMCGYAVSADELFYCISAIFGNKSRRARFRKDLKVLLRKFQKIV